jgi:phospholipid N-methyltransferase
MTKVNVYDANGKNVFSNISIIGANIMEVNTEHFVSGLYVIEVSTSQGVATKKILKP